ncbi:uncharacterized protein TNCV_2318091 [Trichonephila clavipes]|nr:uncharacterized protein TNCV_2318091 [Trichonephila clavipes]
MCSIRGRYGDLEGQGNMSTPCRARCVTAVVQYVWDNHESALAVTGNCLPDHGYKVSKLQTVWLQAFNWPSSHQHAAITGTMAEPVFIRKHNRSPLRLSMKFGLIPLSSQTAMTWSQSNTRYRVPVFRSYP